jgi:hypothetical protein
MTKRKVTQLFAAVAIATAAPMIASADSTKPASATESAKPRTLPSGAPACGNVQIKGRHHPCTAETTPTRQEPVRPPVTTTARAASPVPVIQKLLTYIRGGSTPAVRPRELRNGAPANGNVQGRMAPRASKPVEAPSGPSTTN